MPRATFNPNLVKRFDLETCPEGYVIIRRISLGESAQREQLAMEMAVSGQNANDRKMEISVQVADLMHFDFATMVVEHNLEDENGHSLNFKNPADVNRLDGPIGEEIKKYIDEVGSSKISDETKN